MLNVARYKALYRLREQAAPAFLQVHHDGATFTVKSTDGRVLLESAEAEEVARFLRQRRPDINWREISRGRPKDKDAMAERGEP